MRGSGLNWDLRDINNLENGYNYLDLEIPIGTKGDCYDRYLIRLFEMRYSCKLIVNIINFFKTIDFSNNFLQNNKLVPPNRTLMKNSMESLIHHFKFYTEGLVLPTGFSYGVVEAPKESLVFH